MMEKLRMWSMDETAFAEREVIATAKAVAAQAFIALRWHDVRADARAELRRGDVLLNVVHKGQHTEIRSADQLNKVLSALDKNAVITLQVRRGDSLAFVTVNGLTDKG